jgi:alcohol dehydrogenase class IV
MGLNFQFATASQIIFGQGAAQKIPFLTKEFGNNALLVAGANTDRIEKYIRPLQKEVNVTFFKVPEEPTTLMIKEGVKVARTNSCNVVIGFGGGSAIDSAKAIAALVPNRGDIFDFLEVVGKGKPLHEKPLPCIAVPTTSGTGGEVTKNSVIKSPEHNVKVSLRSNLMYPDVAVVDPLLALTMPPEITASTGVDALTHLLETYVSNQANPFIDLFCIEGMKRVSRSLENANIDGKNIQAREDLAMASLLGGMALANVKLGAVHGFAGPMGGMFSMPHGAICASLLPAVMEENLAVCAEINNLNILKKYDNLAKILTNDSKSIAADGVNWVQNLVYTLRIPKLSEFGLKEGNFDELVGKAKVASSMKGNPVLLNDRRLRTILGKSI